MIRKDKEITDKSIITDIILKSKVCRLSMVDGDRPYMVPLSFGYKDRVLYFHCAKAGKKTDILKINPNVCFEFDHLIDIRTSDNPCNWGMIFQSVIGFGKAEFIENMEEKVTALTTIMSHYSNESWEFPETNVKATTVFKIAVESITGKQSGIQ